VPAGFVAAFQVKDLHSQHGLEYALTIEMVSVEDQPPPDCRECLA